MTKHTIIPAGYRMSITSWENDADYYKTKILEGLSEDEVRFYAALLPLFKSGSNDAKCFGNLNEYSRRNESRLEEAQEAVNKVIEKFRGTVSDSVLDEFSEECACAVGELLGFSEGYTFRVFDKMKIEYIPNPVQFEDVTNKFTKGK